MPELPEVETYVRELAPDLHGRTIVRAAVTWERIIAAPALADFLSVIRGRCFGSFGRRGKFMLLGFTDGGTLIVHLRMTGKLLVKPGDAPIDKHTHVVFELDDGRRVHYNDSRKFGRIWLLQDATLVLHHLGPEPLDEHFSPAALAVALHKRTTAVKTLLLDQRVVAGIGNIYADEVLFAAAVHPTRPGDSLTPDEIAALHGAVRRILTAAIAARGSSLGSSNLQNYRRPGGEQGEFQENHQVFQRTGMACPRCGTPIQRIVVAQRSTHFCPTCQQ